ncbi:hypothetical protein [Inquilinus limosus]|uniref:Uncharacterized protein n=1 Tax=Inquilinus limosus MP06 TaxID=1398085 RepID=A0A0A0DGD1_9PROT|nr:hypothetical protein [Inquilinus limosus]KGM36047.1 hypothetical protein P409_00790 [Inquilinus limosus MP06]
MTLAPTGEDADRNGSPDALPAATVLAAETVRLRLGSSARLRVIDGEVSHVRVAIPTSDQSARFRLGDVLVQVPLDGLDSAPATLRSLASRGTLATACIAGDEDDGWGNLCWLLARDARSVIPKAYDQSGRDWRSLRRWGPAAILSGLALAVSIRCLFASGSWMLLPLLVSASALLLSLAASTFSIMNLCRGFRQRPVLEQSKRLLQEHWGRAPRGASHG